MAVYVVQNRPEERDRHVDLWCAARGHRVVYMGGRRWLRADGAQIVLRPNRGVRSSRPACGRCLVGGPSLGDVPPTGCVCRAEGAMHGGGHWVYDLRDPVRRIAQVGSGRCGRLHHRWDATVRGRLGPDAIWWLYDLIAGDERQRLVVRCPAGPYQDAATARKAEHALREALREAGWQVSSDR